jgi:nicotinamide mononucleotide transporter
MITIIEIIAIIFSLASVILATRKSIITWATGIVGCAAYSIIFYQENLIANFFLQFIFIFQGLHGYIMWKRKKERRSMLVKRLEILSLAILFPAILLTMFIIDNPLPILDSIATTLSISAMYYMARKKSFSWILWMISDVFYIIIFAYTGLTLSFLLYTVFFVLAFKGYKEWKSTECVRTKIYI